MEPPLLTSTMSFKLLKLANFASLLIHILLLNISSVWGNGGAILPSLNKNYIPDRNLPTSNRTGPDLLTLTKGYNKQASPPIPGYHGGANDRPTKKER